MTTPDRVSPPEMLKRPQLAGAYLERMHAWPPSPDRTPEALVTRVTADVMEFRVGNIMPVGFFSLFFVVGFLPFGWVFASNMMPAVSNLYRQGMLGYASVVGLTVLGVIALTGMTAFLAYRTDIQGATADLLTLFDRQERKVYQRVHKRIAKGVWAWDALVPYVETRNALSRVNQALTLVEFEDADVSRPSFVTVQMAGLSKEPLFHTHSFIHAFMDRGVTALPPLRLTALPEPGWYTSMPPWFLGLPRPLAKSFWAFVFLLFVWPLIAWSRLLRSVLPYSRWPAELEAKLEQRSTKAGDAESAWLAKRCQPAEPLPVSARIAFAAAVVVSAPVWWQLLSEYMRMIFDRS